MPSDGSDRLSISVVGPSRNQSRSGSPCINVLAQGGWYVMPEEKDLPSAYYRALEAGMGIVVPVRDHDGLLVISHGPASDQSASFDEFLAERPIWPGNTPVIALQVCSNGLSPLLHRSLLKASGLAPYLYGMTVTDIPGYLDGQIPLYVRQSEHETQPPFYEFAEGVWLDSFERDWFDERLIMQHLRAGKLVTVVSPETNGREHEPMWETIAKLQEKLGELAASLQLCTTRPHEALEYFSR